MSRIGILGAGAVGASIMAMIMDARDSPNEAPSWAPRVSVIADGARAHRLNRDGLVVNGTHYRPCVVDRGPFDLIVVATKSLHLAEALPLLRRAAGGEARIISLMNGITSESVLQEALDGEPGRVIPAMIVGIDAMRDSRGVQYLNRGVIHFGSDPVAFPVSQTVLEEVGATFDAAGIPYSISTDIARTLWWKFMVNVGINQASAILNAPYGLFQQSEEARELMRAAMEEVITLSELEGTGLSTADIDQWVETLIKLDPAGKTSMLQDMESGRETEVALFAGTVLEIARKHGVAAPVNQTLYRIITLTQGAESG